ncbi:MAG: sigma 54-interacting transcriptional regulator [Raoultibacter sp.]
MEEYISDELVSENEKWLLANHEALEALPDALAESWKRSYFFGVDPLLSELPEVTSFGRDILENSAWTKHRRRLESVSLDIGAEALLSAFGAAVIFVDQSLRIYSVIGAQSTVRELAKRNIVYGASLSERSAGANALCVARATGKSSILAPHENYCRIFSRFSSIAEKLSSENNDYAMVLAPEKTLGPRLTAVVEHLLQEYRLFAEAENSAKLKFDSRFLELLLDSDTAFYLAIDSEGRIVSFSPSVLSLLDVAHVPVVGQNIGDFSADMGALVEYIREEGEKGALEQALSEVHVLRIVSQAYTVRVYPMPGLEGERCLGLLFTRLSTGVSLKEKDSLRALQGTSAQVERIKTEISYASTSEVPILIEGELGTGKESIARSIHLASSRRDAPFYPVNCSAVPTDQIRTFLYGSMRDSHDETALGILRQAAGGTLFIDDIDTMPFEMQALLARALEDGSFVGIHSNRQYALEARIIASTTRNLFQMVQEGAFRSDLFYLLNLIAISTTPLRERAEDIAVTVKHISEDLALRYKTQPLYFPKDILEIFRRYPWPNNIRELSSLIESFYVRYPDMHIDLTCLPDKIRFTTTSSGDVPSHSTFSPMKEEMQNPPLPRSYEEHEKQLISDALIRHKGSKTAVAHELGIARQTLYNRMKKYQLL